MHAPAVVEVVRAAAGRHRTPPAPRARARPSSPSRSRRTRASARGSSAVGRPLGQCLLAARVADEDRRGRVEAQRLQDVAQDLLVVSLLRRRDRIAASCSGCSSRTSRALASALPTLSTTPTVQPIRLSRIRVSVKEAPLGSLLCDQASEDRVDSPSAPSVERRDERVDAVPELRGGRLPAFMIAGSPAKLKKMSRYMSRRPRHDVRAGSVRSRRSSSGSSPRGDRRAYASVSSTRPAAGLLDHFAGIASSGRPQRPPGRSGGSPAAAARGRGRAPRGRPSRAGSWSAVVAPHRVAVELHAEDVIEVGDLHDVPVARDDDRPGVSRIGRLCATLRRVPPGARTPSR